MALKERVLQALLEKKDFLSGEKLAEELNVSRTAVWKAIMQLRADGHKITAVNKRGYCLDKENDILNAQQIRQFLLPQCKHLSIQIYDTIDSTNSQAKREISAGIHEEKLIVAQTQTAGRGRRGRSFYSPKDKGIYMSLLLQPNLNIQDGLLITSAVAVAVSRALEKFISASLGIKWVNDIYLNDKKICGILTEAISDFELGILQNVVIGIGVNLRPQDFPPDLQQAASLGIMGVTRNEVIAAIVNSVQDALMHLKEAQLLEEYRCRSTIIGKKISFEQNGITRYAIAMNIDSTGGLIIRLQDGTTTVLNSGEVTVRQIPSDMNP